MRFRPLVLVAVVLCLAGAACSSSPKKPQARPGVTGTVAVQMHVREVAAGELISPARGIRPLDDPTKARVLAAVQKLFDATLVDPLTAGQAGSIDSVFTNDAVRQAATVDRAAMYDEALPRITRLKADKAEVQLTGLAGGNDQAALVIAKFGWDVTGDGGKVHIVRSGELSLIPVLGTWLIAAYDVANATTVDGTTTTTTAVKK